MGADTDLSALFDAIWESTLFRVIAVAAVLIAVAALWPGKKRR